MLSLSTSILISLAVVAAPQTSQVGLRLIAIDTEAEAAALRVRLVAGEAFAALAREHSLDPSATGGGYLGRVVVGDLRIELRNALDGLTPGEVSSVTQMGGEYLLLQLLDDQEAQIADAEAVEATSEDPGADLIDSARSGQSETVEALLLAGVDPNATDANGRTALMRASQEGHVDIIELLLDQGADVNARGALLDAQDNMGWTSLNRAAHNGHAEIVERLITAGADVQIRDDEGYTTLLSAAEAGSDAAIRLLLTAGADIAAQAANGLTALHKAAQSGHLSTVELLISDGASLDARDQGGYTALRYASRGRDGVFAEYPTLATTAIGTHEEYLETARALIVAGADVHVRSDEGTTPLHTAASAGAVDMIALLAELGADLEARNDPVGTAEPFATTGDVLFGYRTPLSVATIVGHMDAVEALLNLGANVMAPDEAGASPLHLVAMRGNVELATLLLDRGAMVDARDRVQQTPLHQAAGGGHLDMTRLLLDRGADVNAQHFVVLGYPRFNIGTAVDVATNGGHIEVLEVLRANGGLSVTDLPN